MSDKSLLGTVDIGFDTIIIEQEKPIQKEPDVVIEIIKTQQCVCNNDDSISDTVDTGFGDQNIIIKECPKFKIPLYKENYLGEFQTPIEKALARRNLEVYSKDEIDKAVSKVLNIDLSEYVTKNEIQKIIKDLNFVDASTKAYVDCIIPDNLFKI